MFLILTKMSRFCITEHNDGVLLRINPLKFNYDPAECSHGLQKAACLWQSLTWIWNNCMRPMFFCYDLSFKGCLCQYFFFLHVLSACFPMMFSIFHCVLFPARVFGYPHHRLFYLSASMLPCLSYIPRYFVVSFLFHLGMFPVPFSKVCCCLPSGSPYFLRVQCLSFASLYMC